LIEVGDAVTGEMDDREFFQFAFNGVDRGLVVAKDGAVVEAVDRANSKMTLG
jgi:hypothetical protein